MNARYLFLRCMKFAALPACVVASYYAIVLLRTPQHFFLKPNPLLAPPAYKKIITLLEQEKLFAHKAQAIHNHLVQEIPTITATSLYFKPIQRVLITCTIAKPIALLQQASQTLCLTDTGRVSSPHFFKRSALNSLPMIAIQNSACMLNTQQQDLASFIGKLDPLVFEQYLLIWYGPQEIIFTSKSDEQSIITTSGIGYHQERFEQAHQLLQQKLQSSPKKKKSWQADIRFRDHIVLAAKQG